MKKKTVYDAQKIIYPVKNVMKDTESTQIKIAQFAKIQIAKSAEPTIKSAKLAMMVILTTPRISV